MSADPYKQGWQQGVRQAIIEAENVANDADNGGEWQDPGTQLRSTLIPALRKMLADAETPVHTERYTLKRPEHGDVMTREDWLVCVKDGSFIDDDGYGYAMKDGKADPTPLYPSGSENLPEDATHVVWFNK